MVDRMKNRKLTDDDIVKEIVNYVDETLYNYAVMIDGEWGCGKTYFIQERLYKALETHENNRWQSERDYKKRKVIYISLYGIKSLDEVTKQLFMESLIAKSGKAKRVLKKGTKAINTMLPVVFDVLKNKGIDINLKKITETTEKLMSIRESILIFDDLERCDCPTNEILGYINSFVEHENMKVIIVANQKEIGKGVSSANQELKYLVAAHNNILFEKDQKSEVINQYLNSERKNENTSPVDIETVKNRVQKLFVEDNLYDKVKEKLIGVTIYYQPDLQTVFKKLITSAKLDDNLKKYLYDDIDFFEEYMINEAHANIRTFQFFLSKINQLHKKLIQLEDKGREAFLKYIIKYEFKISVSFKNGDYKYGWKGTEEYAFKSIGSIDIFGNQLSFRFVDDFITKSILEDGRIKDMFELFANEYLRKSSPEKEAFAELDSHWYELTDIVIEKKIDIILKGLENDAYDVKDYPRIINRFLELQEHGFPEDNTIKMIENMKISLSKLSHYIEIDNGYGVMYEGDRRNKYQRIVIDLQKDIDQKFQNNYSNTLDSYLTMKEGWGEKMENYVFHNKNEICSSRGFLRELDFDKLYERIEAATSKDLQAFRSCIINLYTRGILGEALEEESMLLPKLRQCIENVNTEGFDRIKKMQISFLVENLKAGEKVYFAKQS